MKKKVVLLMCAFSAVHASCLLYAADLAPYLPIANIPEKWATNDSGWKLASPSDGVKSYSASSGAIAIKFYSQQVPMSDQRGAICADGTASSGLFVGNYTNSAIDKIVFDVMYAGVLGGNTKIRLTSADGRVLEHAFQVPDVTGVWGNVEIPLGDDGGWIGAASSDERSQILATVTQLTVIVYGRKETAGGMLYVDNLKLVGPWEKGPLTDDKMPEFWLTQNGFTAADGHAAEDEDNDGFNNYSEYVAGTDPRDASSQFRIEIAADGSGHPVVKWRHVDYRKFTVLASDDLTKPDGFQPVQSQISSQSSGNEWVDGSAQSQFRVYKVQIEAP